MRLWPQNCHESIRRGRPEDGPAGTRRCQGSPSKNACRSSAWNVPSESSSSDQEERACSTSPYSRSYEPRDVSHIQRKVLLQKTPDPPESIVHHQALRKGCVLAPGCSCS